MKEVAEVRGITIFANRTVVNGVEYFSDDIGGGQRVVDMTTVDIEVLKWIVDNHKQVDQTLPNRTDSDE